MGIKDRAAVNLVFSDSVQIGTIISTSDHYKYKLMEDSNCEKYFLKLDPKVSDAARIILEKVYIPKRFKTIQFDCEIQHGFSVGNIEGIAKLFRNNVSYAAKMILERIYGR